MFAIFVISAFFLGQLDGSPISMTQDVLKVNCTSEKPDKTMPHPDPCKPHLFVSCFNNEPRAVMPCSEDLIYDAELKHCVSPPKNHSLPEHCVIRIPRTCADVDFNGKLPVAGTCKAYRWCFKPDREVYVKCRKGYYFLPGFPACLYAELDNRVTQADVDQCEALERSNGDSDTEGDEN